MSKLSLITKGFVKDNPTFALVLGMCPTLATTTSAMNGLEMGLATMFVLILSNMAISLVAPAVPDKVRIPAYIVIIATFVTVLQLLMQAYVPAVYETLGLFIPLIVVNCIVLGRAEAFANKNSVIDSACDGLGIGLGFTMSLTVIGINGLIELAAAAAALTLSAQEATFRVDVDGMRQKIALEGEPNGIDRLIFNITELGGRAAIRRIAERITNEKPL